MNKIYSLLKSFAVSNWQKYSFKREWAAVIVLLIVLKLATSAVSIFSGFYYLDNFFFSFTNSDTAAKVFAVVALILIEGLCALFLAKFFKFAIRLEFATAAMPLTCAALVFWISFIVSTNGIAIYANQSEDLSKDINAKYNAAIESAKAQCAANVKQANDYIATLKANPQGWSGGKRCMLSDFQTQEVAKAFESIESYKRAFNETSKEIEKQRNLELSENNRATIDTADRYYKIVTIIMIVQVVCSGGLWFFWCKIAGQDAPDVDYKESVQDIYDKANSLIDNGLAACITAKFDIITDAFKTLNDDMKMKEIAAKSTAPRTAARRTGFAVPETPQTPPEIEPKTPDTKTQINAATVAVSDVANVSTTAQNAVNANAVCEHCGKALTASQIVRHAKYCSPRCRVAAYNIRNPERKPIVISNSSLKD